MDNGRKLKITVPIYNYDKIKKIIPDLYELVKYMTNGENWDIQIVKNKGVKKIDTGRLDLQTKKYNNVCLLSGGLDAFSGALAEKYNKTLYITTKTNGAEVINAEYVYKEFLMNDMNSHIIIDKYNLSKDTHYTQRTRTLFFLANAFIFADYFKISEIKMYENGIMSLNPKF